MRYAIALGVARLVGRDIEASIDLHRIDVHYLAADGCCQLTSEERLACAGRAHDHNHDSIVGHDRARAPIASNDVLCRGQEQNVALLFLACQLSRSMYSSYWYRGVYLSIYLQDGRITRLPRALDAYKTLGVGGLALQLGISRRRGEKVVGRQLNLDGHQRRDLAPVPLACMSTHSLVTAHTRQPCIPASTYARNERKRSA